jgi:hypothetical protein
MLFRDREIEKACPAFGLGSKVVVGVFSARFPGAGQAMGLPVIPSPWCAA